MTASWAGKLGREIGPENWLGVQNVTGHGLPSNGQLVGSAKQHEPWPAKQLSGNLAGKFDRKPFSDHFPGFLAVEPGWVNHIATTKKPELVNHIAKKSGVISKFSSLCTSMNQNGACHAFQIVLVPMAAKKIARADYGRLRARLGHSEPWLVMAGHDQPWPAMPIQPCQGWP